MVIRMYHEQKLLDAHECNSARFEENKVWKNIAGCEKLVAIRRDDTWKCMASDFPVTRFELGK